MARCSSSNSGSLTTRLSSCANYLEAVEELRAKLLHSSPSYLISNPEKLISLVEVAKSTLQSNGVSLHTFASCPDNLSAHKDTYFGLLLQLQAHGYSVKLDSKELRVRLRRLLFPLSTQLKVYKKAVPGGYGNQVCGVRRAGNDHACSSPETKASPLGSESSSGSSLSTGSCSSTVRVRSSSLSILPPNVMMPPPAPIKRSTSWLKPLEFIPSEPVLDTFSTGFSKPLGKGRSSVSSRRKASHDTVHFKRRHADPITPSATHSGPGRRQTVYNMPEGLASRSSLSLHDADSDEMPSDQADSFGSSSDDDDDADSDSTHVVVPAHSPLRRSFGIFCTGKGRGAFSGPVGTQRSRLRPSHGSARRTLRRESREHTMDTDS